MQLKSPKQRKYKKSHKHRICLTGLTGPAEKTTFGEFGLTALESGRVTARHIDAMRKTARRLLRRTGRLWIPVFPHTPVTAKPLEIRMGKGKGAVSYWTSNVRAGMTLIEIAGVPTQQAIRVLMAVLKKLPIRAHIVIN